VLFSTSGGKGLSPGKGNTRLHLKRKKPPWGGSGSPNGFRTRVSGVRGQYPRPLDDGTIKSNFVIIWPFFSLVNRKEKIGRNPDPKMAIHRCAHPPLSARRSRNTRRMGCALMRSESPPPTDRYRPSERINRPRVSGVCLVRSGAPVSTAHEPTTILRGFRAPPAR
jgi:hypothetical protein